MRNTAPPMTQPGSGGRQGGGFSLAHGLWIAAASVVIAGFILRVLGGLLALPHLRFSGVAALALGLMLAGLGWISERLAARRPH